MNWRAHADSFSRATEKILNAREPVDLSGLLQEEGVSDGETILGVPEAQISYLEFLFFQAEGPYSPSFQRIAPAISLLFSASEPLRTLLNLNAADAIGNMILNKRGRLKFAIADHLELILVLDWWSRFGLLPVCPRDIFDAILKKTTIAERIEKRDPVLLLRLAEVFPAYWRERAPDCSFDELRENLGKITPLPSHRRYHALYKQIRAQNRDLLSVIREEEERILPMEERRNHYLAYLVRKYLGDSCQICGCTSDITIHHIIPLSKQGYDRAENMMAVCRRHHDEIHAGKIQVEKIGTEIRVRSDTKEDIIPGIRYPEE